LNDAFFRAGNVVDDPPIYHTVAPMGLCRLPPTACRLSPVACRLSPSSQYVFIPNGVVLSANI